MLTKTKFMIFHTPNRNIIPPNIIIDNNQVECVDHFNCLGIIFDKHMSWKKHVDHIACKIAKSVISVDSLSTEIVST